MGHSAEGQRGYRDAILWESILKWNKAHLHEVLFVSRNTRDFADPGDSHKLHQHLIEDLRSLNQDESSVQLFVGFEDLLARALSPRQRLFPELEAQVENGRLGQHDLIPLLTRMLPGIAVQLRTERLRYNDWVIREIRDIVKLSLGSTSRLTEHTILIILIFMFTADVVPKQPEFPLEEVREIRTATFVSLVAVEFGLEDNAIVSVEFDHVICVNDEPTVQG